MKVLSLAFSVLACAIAFGVSTVPVHAQWELADVSFDPTLSSEHSSYTGNAEANVTVSNMNMDVTASASGSSPGEPSYTANAMGIGVYYANFSWSGNLPPDSEFEFTLDGDVDGSSTIDNAAGTATSSITDYADSSLDLYGTTTINVSSSYDTAYPPATSETVSLGSPVPSSTSIEFQLLAHANAGGGGGTAGSSSTSSESVLNLSI